jgi:hypothetical protein
MKKIAVLAMLLLVIVFVSCKEKEPVRYATTGLEIDLVKSLIEDYEKGDWDAWLAHYADTAKLHHNATKDISLSAKEVHETLKVLLANTSSYGFDKDSFYERVIDDEGETWVNFWGDWKGTMAANNKELIIPVHITSQIVNGKIVEEHGYYNLSEYMANMQEIEAAIMVKENLENQ